ncbi:hypothetical protein [Frateuria hangzhouensis]|uniref:hypothetical protein n=1 Tax=Frateuria hangzhouensis TaxID=2995589 RepID=UPI003CCC61AB
MPVTLAFGLAAMFLLLVGAGAFVLLGRRRRLDQRSDSMLRLLELADQLEADLKTCRNGLKQAHAVMSLNPDQPAAGEQEATQAIDAGLRSLLQQRLWIRDCAPDASQQGLDEAAADMSQTRARLRPLVNALERAHHDLDDAMREHIRRESDV